MKTNRHHTNHKAEASVAARAVHALRDRLAKRKAEEARREFNVWAWEQNRQGRQVPVGHM